MLDVAHLLLISTLAVATCSPNTCVLRYRQGDVVCNTTSCYNNAVNNTSSCCHCPEESPTFVQESNSCVQDATLLNGELYYSFCTRLHNNYIECDLQLDVKNSRINSSAETIPYVFVHNYTKELHILPNSGIDLTVMSGQKATIRFKNDSRALHCDSVRNISLISGQHYSPSLQLMVQNNSIQV